eukprot:TRINITY_DN2591_c0_g1_i2.p1 TRINITY_DN2591_c0_g1~~TRINITY_DN2591_c0_g1_i2.p1  ORF type:complete len:57 (-),score=1.23 TRINITY_DN2591_c0_g1_i2:99-269(-)
MVYHLCAIINTPTDIHKSRDKKQSQNREHYHSYSDDEFRPWSHLEPGEQHCSTMSL